MRRGPRDIFLLERNVKHVVSAAGGALRVLGRGDGVGLAPVHHGHLQYRANGALLQCLEKCLGIAAQHGGRALRPPAGRHARWAPVRARRHKFCRWVRLPDLVGVPRRRCRQQLDAAGRTHACWTRGVRCSRLGAAAAAAIARPNTRRWHWFSRVAVLGHGSPASGNGERVHPLRPEESVPPYAARVRRSTVSYREVRRAQDGAGTLGVDCVPALCTQRRLPLRIWKENCLSGQVSGQTTYEWISCNH